MGEGGEGISHHTFYNGDSLQVLKTFPSESVNCCVTSPPYFGLRDYGIDGQIGLETTPAEYVDRLVQVFREVRRVLRDDGVAWVNLGDSYCGGGRGCEGKGWERGDSKNKILPSKVPLGLKPKDLLGIPWRVAFALQADGWYLRSDIIWHKPNPMPESVTDRPTKSHEYIFLLAKSEKYWYDHEAIKEPGQDEPGTHRGGSLVKAAKGQKGDAKVAWHNHGGSFESLLATGYRNKRDVWTIATIPWDEAHFATFPPALIEPCILAGCPPGGVVLDPFGGAGTTATVAMKHNRNSIYIDLNPEYLDMAVRRCGFGQTLMDCHTHEVRRAVV